MKSRRRRNFSLSMRQFITIVYERILQKPSAKFHISCTLQQSISYRDSTLMVPPYLDSCFSSEREMVIGANNSFRTEFTPRFTHITNLNRERKRI
uniref:Uncharacterized protein n=1 Tax=Arundo donax TaxID=35708 RepID=A0A0A9S3Y2_ARUDO